jgi:hypothetical protein
MWLELPLTLGACSADLSTTALPFTTMALVACCTPSRLITPDSRLAASPTPRRSVAPSRVAPAALVTLAPVAPPAMANSYRPPLSDTVAAVAPPRAIMPPVAMMLPRLMTEGATSATSPAPCAVMLPSLTTLPVAPVICAPPVLMKLLASILPVVAISEPTFTTAPCPNITPFGFISITMPLADRLPRICEALASPVMRFRMADAALGCWISTALPTAILKEPQSITARLVVWLMVIWLPATEPEAVPATTVPFCGRPAAPVMSTVQPGGANSSAIAAGRVFRAKEGLRREGAQRLCG